MDKIRVLIMDDHSVVRIGLNALLKTDPGIEVVGEAEDGNSAVRKSRDLKPDVVLMDLQMPEMDGVAATEAIHAELPEAQILILTTFGTSNGIEQALNAGATGAILKSAPDSELIDSIRKTAKGEPAISEEVKQLILRDPKAPTFTNRQMEILTSITKGYTNRQIGKQLGIREDGVGKHLTAIFAKLGVSSRAEAVAIALRKHLLKI